MTARRIYAAAFVRALATGMIAVRIGIDLAERGFAASAIGLVVTAGLYRTVRRKGRS
jgi:hypothetical protein